MATHAAPQGYEIKAEGLTLAIVSTRWNERIVSQLNSRAVARARELGAKVDQYLVAGALELPVVVQECARRYDAVVALGCVIRGETAHFTYVCDSVTAGLTRIALDESTPVGNGVLTVDEEDQAWDRAGGPDTKEDKGAEAVEAALSAVVELNRVRAHAPRV
ncbi:6,7-dimethyl-8-ribityllumazine synthase [Corynebacterium timonense]|uniref:6,7-dimethyl-8-ribityllumazine synthase n=1 Tax=Corynebacterium timonense TaxID=441500 RepID=A0A1H1NU89_9CORY|nr:6,7-dimethyl-8-ribityllumazine synthase [Corynebacterium timonense]SDS02547.1 6,7-dimethyl-8-ribityllumazine synthase [Corynebacterium timonense]